MTDNVVQIPKINGKLFPPIITSTGLKQGDNLSPILFDIFFDDVDQILDSQCDPVTLNSEISLHYLLYVDDMAILSLSQEGLQNSLYKLEAYCKEWYLVVSIKKKIVVFNKTGKLFNCECKHIELVTEFKYLRISGTASG